MQSSKTSKKTRKTGDETSHLAEVASAAEVTAKPRTTRSSKSKSEASETGSVKHRGAATKPVMAEEDAPAVEVKAMAAVVGSSQSVEAVELVAMEAAQPGAVVAQAEPVSTTRAVSYDDIAALAHSYWVARGYAPGSPEQDWLRAERELASRA